MSKYEPERPFGESWRCVGGSYRCLVLRVYDTNGRMRLSDINCRAYVFSSISKDGVVFKNAVRLEDRFVPGFPDDSLVYDMTNLLREAGAGRILSGFHQFLSLPMKKVEEVLEPYIQYVISSGADPQVLMRDCRVGYVRRAHLIMQERSMTRITDELEAELQTLVDAIDMVEVDL